MAATTGTMTLQDNARTYSVDIYVEDAATGLVRFNAAGLAGAASATQLRIPTACVIIDVSVEAKTTASGFIISNNSGVLNGSALRYNVQLTSLANRQKLRIPLSAGDIIAGNNF